MTYPRPITQIHQLELTSRCNLACRYCIQTTMRRLHKDMDWPTFERSLDWVKFFCDKGTQSELNLAGVGESFLHPRFAEMVAAARAVVGSSRRLILATNGIAVTERVVREIAPYNPRFYVSLHRPDRAAPGLVILREAGLLDGISTDPATNANDWAGQVDWAPGRRGKQMPCPWLRAGWAYVASNGAILTCCIDGTAESAIGHVNDPPAELQMQPWRLCEPCYQEP